MCIFTRVRVRARVVVRVRARVVIRVTVMVRAEVRETTLTTTCANPKNVLNKCIGLV